MKQPSLSRQLDMLFDSVMDLYEQVGTWFVRRTCDHKWRPAVKGSVKLYPCRYCDRCGTLEFLSQEMFYAYFGRTPW